MMIGVPVIKLNEFESGILVYNFCKKLILNFILPILISLVLWTCNLSYKYLINCSSGDAIMRLRISFCLISLKGNMFENEKNLLPFES
jgi:hypothetical protein